jgi:serine/threonine-protein kinase
MDGDPRVRQLLEALLDSEHTPEEVCRDCPELLPQVRKHWRRKLLCDAQLDLLFPAPVPDPATGDPSPKPPSTDLPKIPGHELHELLGRGGMGIVYKARHVRLNRSVAVKMLLTGAHASPESRERFLREAEAAAGLRHPNIVQVHDLGEQDGLPYFTMEFVEGGNLAQKLADTPLPPRQASALVATLAEAVQAAHRSGIVHRDLKPSNILLTADGMPKISDFGLARRMEGEAGLTWTGIAIGTPSYMAPEQAEARPLTSGPAVDIYALGAILYELLTGRPPFRAETAAETVRQVISQDPVPPSRLNGKVPRDLETIGLKCLNKEPHLRYASAAALAADLHRFLAGEAIAARPDGRLARLARRVRRRPVLSAAVAVGTLFTVALLGGGLWLISDRAAVARAIEAKRATTERAADADLREMGEWMRKASWPEAKIALDRAKARLGDRESDDLRERLGQAQRDLDLVIKLDAIRLKRVTHGELAFYKAQANRDYAEAFQQAGLGRTHDESSIVAAMINASAVRGALVVAVDDWVVCAADAAQRGWLGKVTRQADPDPEGWRDRILDPAAWDDPAALSELARTVPARQSVSLLLILGERLKAVGGDAPSFLKRVQKDHPADFWANLVLGNVLLRYRKPEQASGYYRAALASRPRAAVGYCAVGDALRHQNLLDEATEYYKMALRLDPDYARAYSDLGLVLQAEDRLDEAIDSYRHAVRLDPTYAWAHHNLANALQIQGRLDEAYHHGQQADRLDPDNPEVRKSLRLILLLQGRGEELQTAWRKALDADPSDHKAWYGYAEFCLFLGREEEYLRARRALLEKFGATLDPSIAERTSRACLLRSASEEEWHQIVALAGRAGSVKKAKSPGAYPFFQFVLGLAEFRQGHLDRAITLMRGEASGVLGPSPRLVLAMALHKSGRVAEARKTLAEAVLANDWRAVKARDQDGWIRHVLRREAETMILPDLPAFLDGKREPQDNDERLALLGICQFTNRTRALARLYADTFVAAPQLAEDVRAGHRYNAARAAAQAGCGHGEDGGKLSQEERTHWRQQAHAWLEFDLAAWTMKLDDGTAANRRLVGQTLTGWLADPDLAGLREPGALKMLPAEERNEWLAFWKQVEALMNRTSSR